MKTLFIPIDNRPVTYLLPQMLSQLAGITAVVPPRSLMGSLNKPGQVGPLLEWVDLTLAKEKIDSLLVCLDSMLYGGLINSRRCSESLKEITERASHLTRWRNALRQTAPILAHASIMRISDNYDASEEKCYWASYGREIFSWSEYLHRLALGQTLTPGILTTHEFKIPKDVREDYLATRRRNLLVNRHLLSFAESKTINLLIFSLDDSGQFGLNVLEKERLLAEIREKGLTEEVALYPGSDEVLCTLLSRLLVITGDRAPTAFLSFSPTDAALCPSRYEGQTVAATVYAQIKASGISLQESLSASTDFHIIIHGSDKQQGDHIWLKGLPDMRYINTQSCVRHTIGLLEKAQKPCVVCDVAYANGSDPLLVEALLERKDLVAKLWAYAGWNTTANTVGSALAMGVARWFAQQNNIPQRLCDDALKQCLFTRFADDFAYQTKVRPTLETPISLQTVKTILEPHLKIIAQALEFEPKSLTVSLPWQRAFEIEIDIAQF